MFVFVTGQQAWSGIYDEQSNNEQTKNEQTENVEFTPEQQKAVDNLVLKAKEAGGTALRTLESLQKKMDLTKKERDELDAQIKMLQGQLRTKEELAEQEREASMRQHREELSAAQNESLNWKTKFTNLSIENAIIHASSMKDHEAFSSRAIIALLRGSTKLVDELNDVGKPTGNLVPRVEYQTLDKEKKPVTLDLSVPEAVKRMSDEPEFAHLFKNKAPGGLGGKNNGQPSDKIDLAELARTDPAAYRKFREDHKELFEKD